MGKDHTITNFPSIPLHFANHFILQDIGLCTSSHNKVMALVGQLVEELFPYRSPVFFTQIVIPNDDVDSRDEGIVEVADSVSRRE